jgi:exosortase/archaeosortase family protein
LKLQKVIQSITSKLNINKVFSVFTIRNSFSIFTSQNPTGLKKKKESKSQAGPKKDQQRSGPDADQNKEQKPVRPPKPLFSKELLIKLLPLIKAFALWFVLVLIVHIPGIKEVFRNIFVGFTTSSTVLIGKMLFIPIQKLSFSAIMLDGFSMDIIVECTAYNFYLFAIALAVFANWSLRHKLINLLIFIGVIFLTNILRFFAMGYVGRYYPDFFDTTHDYVWNILFGFMIFGVWAWRDKVDNPDFQPKDPQP